jgi:hypothetical protein
MSEVFPQRWRRSVRLQCTLPWTTDIKKRNQRLSCMGPIADAHSAMPEGLENQSPFAGRNLDANHNSAYSLAAQNRVQRKLHWAKWASCCCSCPSSNWVDVLPSYYGNIETLGQSNIRVLLVAPGASVYLLHWHQNWFHFTKVVSLHGAAAAPSSHTPVSTCVTLPDHENHAATHRSRALICGHPEN